MDGSGGKCFPSLELLATETGLARSAVSVALKALEAANWIGRSPGGGAGRSTRYQAYLPESYFLSVEQADNRPLSALELSVAWTGDSQEYFNETDRKAIIDGEGLAGSRSPTITDASSGTSDDRLHALATMGAKTTDNIDGDRDLRRAATLAEIEMFLPGPERDVLEALYNELDATEVFDLT